MSLVVADTSPIRYLIAIGEINLLQSLFEKIFIPLVVADELNHQSAPDAVRSWMRQPPEWRGIVSLKATNGTSLAALDQEERFAIELGISMNADLIHLDDRKGASAAVSNGFAVAGTLGILDLAAERGLVNLGGALDRLKLTNFRYRQALLDALLKKHGQ